MLRTAVRGWLGFMDGACLDWVAHDATVDREALHGLLLGTLMGAVLAAGEAATASLISSMSTTNTSVSFGPIGPEPLVAVGRVAAGSTSRRRPPSFMPSMPWSQPGMTCPAERERERLAAAVPGGVELRAVLEEHARVLDGDGLAGGGLRRPCPP